MTEQLIKKIIIEEVLQKKIYENIFEQTIVNKIYEEILLERKLTGEPMTVPELRKLLRQKVLNFEFIKLNGEKRKARGTTRMDKIPKEDHPKGTGKSSPKVATFYDLDKKDWRSVSQDSDEIVVKKDKEKDRPIIIVKEKPESEKEKEKQEEPEIEPEEIPQEEPEKQEEPETEEIPQEEPETEEIPQEEPEDQYHGEEEHKKEPQYKEEHEPILKANDIRKYKNINNKEILIKILRIDDDNTVYAETYNEHTPFTIPPNMLKNIGNKIVFNT